MNEEGETPLHVFTRALLLPDNYDLWQWNERKQAVADALISLGADASALDANERRADAISEFHLCEDECCGEEYCEDFYPQRVDIGFTSSMRGEFCTSHHWRSSKGQHTGGLARHPVEYRA